MSALRSLWERVLETSMLQWLGAGAGTGGTPPVASPELRVYGDGEEHARLSEREREIELRILMSNWM